MLEGVTLYLHEEQVLQTLELVQKNSGHGSSVIADWYSTSGWLGRIGRRVLKHFVVAEPFKFGLDFARPNPRGLLSSFLKEKSKMELREAWFFGGRRRICGGAPYMCVAECVCTTTTVIKGGKAE